MCVIQREREIGRKRAKRIHTHTNEENNESTQKHNKSNRNMYVQIFEIIRLFLKKIVLQKLNTKTKREREQRVIEKCTNVKLTYENGNIINYMNLKEKLL